MKFFRITFICVFPTLILGDCATSSQDGGFGEVKKVSTEHIKQEIVWPKSEVEQKTVADRVT